MSASDSSRPSAPVASAPKEEELERQIAVYADAKAKGVLDLERCLCGLPAVATMPVLAEGFSLPVCRKHWKSSVPSTRTVTRWNFRRNGELLQTLVGTDVVVQGFSSSDGLYLASEVDPLLTALAATEHWQLMIDNDTLLARLAEREQEIAELKAERDHLKKALTVSP